MGEKKLKQDGFSKMENFKEQFTLVPRRDSPDNIIGGNVYSSQYNSVRTSMIARRHNTGFKSVSRERRATRQLTHCCRVGL